MPYLCFANKRIETIGCSGTEASGKRQPLVLFVNNTRNFIGMPQDLSISSKHDVLDHHVVATLLLAMTKFFY